MSLVIREEYINTRLTEYSIEEQENDCHKCVYVTFLLNITSLGHKMLARHYVSLHDNVVAKAVFNALQKKDSPEVLLSQLQYMRMDIF